ncbi:MAG: hypothetical protein H6Q75_350 [Firmicutes bacterium]|nr:hypothetical protein [Bacillota bacterium]
MRKKTSMQSFASEYAMSAGDNAVTRRRIDQSIVSKDVANEHSFRKAAENRLAHFQEKPENEGGRI